MPETIYILTNPSLRGVIKIGRTNKLKERIQTLSSSPSIPEPFECYYACTVMDGFEVEKRIHFAFENDRVSPKREFFKVEPEKIMQILELQAIQDVTPDKKTVQELVAKDAPRRGKKPNTPEKRKSRTAPRKASRFSDLKIPRGSELQFVKDASITCRVVDDKQVEFGGTRYALSKLATKILREKYRLSMTSSVNGFAYWKFKSEVLSNRRSRLEKQNT